MLRLPDMYISDEDADKLMDKLSQYNKAHPDDELTLKDFSKMLMEYGINYLDISALC